MKELYIPLVFVPFVLAILYWPLVLLITVSSFLYGKYIIGNKPSKKLYLNQRFISCGVGLTMFALLFIPGAKSDFARSKNYKPHSNPFLPDFIAINPFTDTLLTSSAIGLYTWAFVMLMLFLGRKIHYQRS